MSNARSILIALSIKHNGDWEKVYEAIRNKQDISSEEVEELNAKVTCKTLTILDEDYPEYFKQCWKPPFVLFYKGNLELLHNKKRLSIVGSRKPTTYGLEMTKKTAVSLAMAGYSIISGLAKGIDGEALLGAVPYGKAVAFLGNGVNVYYPSENFKLQKEMEKKGLVMSEYPENLKPNTQTFPFRNRLISYASKALLVSEAKVHSGTMISANYAIQAGHDVLCFPSRANEDSLCNRLIKEGALLVEGVDDIIYELEGK